MEVGNVQTFFFFFFFYVKLSPFLCEIQNPSILPGVLVPTGKGRQFLPAPDMRF